MPVFLLLIAFFYPFLISAQLPAYVPSSNLEGFYLFSGNVSDISGNANNTTNHNVIFSDDRNQSSTSALQFNGDNSTFLNYGDVDNYEPYIASFSFWIYPEAYGGDSSRLIKPIISKWSVPGDWPGSSYNIFINSSHLCFLFTDGITTDTLKTPLSNILLNQWTHVVITSSYGFIKIYINNILVSDAMSPISSINLSQTDFKVGDWYQDTDSTFSSFTGKIDDIGIWSKELDTCEVEALFTGNACLLTGLEKINTPKNKEVVKIIDFIGRETDKKHNTPLIYIYKDGSIERKIIFRD